MTINLLLSRILYHPQINDIDTVGQSMLEQALLLGSRYFRPWSLDLEYMLLHLLTPWILCYCFNCLHPLLQSRSLILQSQDKKYRPVFFRKVSEEMQTWKLFWFGISCSFSFLIIQIFQEDLENSLFKASNQQNRLNPAFRQGDIQVLFWLPLWWCFFNF